MAKKINKDLTKEFNNVSINFDGTVSIINYSSEKLFDGKIAINEKTPNNKTMTHYVHCKWYHPSMELEKGDVVTVNAKFGTDTYKDKQGKTVHKLIVIINDCEVV